MKQPLILGVLLHLLLSMNHACQAFDMPIGYVEENKYICGDAFLRHFNKHVIGRSNYAITEPHVSFSPESIKDGDIIFVNTPYLNYFFEAIHPHITCNYILVSHGGDDSVPGKNARFLDDPTLLKWFAVNKAASHPKLTHIPLGLANAAWEHGNKKIIDEVRALVATGVIQKDQLLYMNFNKDTNWSLRSAVYDIFAQKPFCTKALPKPFRDYLYELAHYKFIVSPHGNGLDCHRTWEALVIGCIPIVKTSSLDPLYKNLPVLIVNDWSEVTEEMLNKKFAEIRRQKYDERTLFIDYWIEKILKFQTTYLNNKKLGIGSTNEELTHKSAVTYILNGGRLGDNLLNYLHAKWFAYYYKIPLLFVPFEYSDQLGLDENEPFHYQDYKNLYTTTVNLQKNTDPLVVDPNAHILYRLGYFPEQGLMQYDYIYFPVGWDYPDFKAEIQRLIRPHNTLQLIRPPQGKASIAVHVRTGGGFDNDPHWISFTPEKFLSDTFYINGIKTIADTLHNQPIYVFIFTDHEHPETIATKFKNALLNYPQLEFDYRREHNAHNANVLEDFFSMMLFDYLIRSEANLAVVASKLGSFTSIIKPHSMSDTIIGSPNNSHSFYVHN